MNRHLLYGLTWLLTLGTASAGVWTNRLVIPDRQALASWNCTWTTSGIPVQIDAGQRDTLDFLLQPGRPPAITGSRAPRLPNGFDNLLQKWPVPTPATPVVTLSLRRQSQAWLLYVADQPVARFQEPWTNAIVTIRHPADLLPPDGLRDEYVQRLAPFRFDDTFLIPKTTTNQFPDTWERLHGDWQLHSVTGGVSGALAGRKLGRQPTPERSPNFYSLQGHGVVLAGESFRHRYRFRAAVQHNGGTNGLLFLVTDTGACHGFTTYTDPATERLVFQLWRGHTATHTPRQLLTTVATELLAGQWTLMEVQLFDDRLVCLADNIEILRQQLPLPSGGRFGLIADTPQETRFDDVAVTSHEDYPFETPAELCFQTLQRTGTFRLPASAPLAPAGGAPAAVAFRSPDEHAPRQWIFGATDDAAHQLECCFLPQQPWQASYSLLAGWQGPGQPYYQFTCWQAGNRRLASLTRIEPTTNILLDCADLGTATSGPVRLTLDALRPDELRGLVNGRLVVVARPDEPVVGAGGIRLERGGEVRLSLPRYVSHVPLYTDRFEKNPAYVNDPFMRHWAAPEGQWITMRDGLTWLRSDIFGRAKLHLPVVEGSVLHLAIPEGETNGQCTITIRNGTLSAFTPATGTNSAFAIPTESLPTQYMENVGAARIYTVNVEDDVLWISCVTNILGRCHLPPLRRARRARIEGLGPDQLRQTLLQRENVFDTLFNESLFAWTINGGTWEVVNRFQCEPTWSHMNGENATSFAGLWSKMELSGDFCVDFFAGTRMGWYDRPGDYNLTVHSRSNFPSDGYSVTLAGWDPDWSQRDTRLFRQGRQVASSSAYTAPRVREGNLRRGYEPLVTSANRPVHGAWYGMRFRRVGDQLSYLFDNEPVLSWQDPAPLEGGALGIWTYRNSIMVARVRIAAEAVRPRPFRFWRVPNATPATRTVTSQVDYPDLRIHGRPVEQLAPAIWQDADPVSQPLVRFLAGREASPVMHVTALEGGGTFLVAPRLPIIPSAQLLGWHFEVARHPAARFNFEFSAGATNQAKAAQLADACAVYSFVLCGSDDPRGERRIAGRLAQPPPASAADATLDQLVWTPVDVWLPVEARQPGSHVRLDGFGNLQPSDIQQGLDGNPPGAWYAIRNFREILAQPPTLTSPELVQTSLVAVATQSAQRQTSLVAIAAQVAQRPTGQRQALRLPATLDARQPTVEWVTRTETDLGLVALPDPLRPDTLRITATTPWPNPLLPARLALLDESPVRGVPAGNDYLVLLPRPIPPPTASNGILRLELANGRTFQQRLPLSQANTSQPPLLLTCELPNGGIQTFEDYSLSGRADPASLVTPDPQQGAYLRFQNNGLPNNRLNGPLLFRYDLETTPLLQFRYRADRLAQTSLTSGRSHFAFSENFGMPAAIGGTTALLDRAWHTWLGAPGQAMMCSIPLRGGFALQPRELSMGSRGRADQTGRYSDIALDDIASGPVVGPGQPLTFRPQFTTTPELAEVRYALAAGAEPWSVRAETGTPAASWQSITNQQLVTPDVTPLPDGIHHLCLQARQIHGIWSGVYDIPFLLVRQSPQVSATICDTPDRYNGTCLTITMTGTPAPVISRNLTLKFQDQPLNLASDNGQAIHSNGTWTLELDWPWLLRKPLNASTNGTLLALTLAGIQDGASNMAPPCTIPIPLDFAADRQPPTVLPLQTPANFLALQPQLRAKQNFFQKMTGFAPVAPIVEEGFYVQSFLCPTGELASLVYRGAWQPETFPWLAINLRTTAERDGPQAPFDLQLRPAAALPAYANKPKTGDVLVCNLMDTNVQRFVVGRMDWRPGQWNEILVNVRDLLRDQFRLTNACPLQELTLVFPPRTNFTFQLRSMAIVAPWKTNDVINCKAYDASGVAGITWQDHGSSTNTAIRPAVLTLPASHPPWLKLRVADRAGNLTPAYLFPLPPTTNPVPDNLPLTFPVEDKDF
jgi:hypothetical protein